MKRVNPKLISLCLITIIIAIIFFTEKYWGGILSKLFSIIIPFLLAFILAYALHPLVKWLQKKKFPKGLAVTVVILGFISLIALLGIVVIPTFGEQLVSFLKNILQFVKDMNNKLDFNIGGFSVSITDSLNSLIGKVGNFISEGTLSIINASLVFFTISIIGFIVSIYFLVDMDNIRKTFKKFLRTSKQPKTYLFFKKLDNQMTTYVKGYLIYMLILFVEYTILFKIAGHPNFLLLGILCAVGSIIPFIGGIVANAFAIITAATISTPVFIFTTIIAIVFPNIDGNFTMPKIFGKTNNLNPILTIFMVFAGSVLFGFWGIVFALPVTIILTTTYEFYEENIKETISNIKQNIKD